MVSRVRTFAFTGLEATQVDVQVHISPGFVMFNIVGLADKAVGESRERVRAALNSLGLSLPAERITVNLAPADLQKEGSHFDLPIALAILVAMDVIPQNAIEKFCALGELSLDGRITKIAGVLPAAIAANESNLGIICPQENGSEAAFASEDMGILAADNLLTLINHFKGTNTLTRPTS